MGIGTAQGDLVVQIAEANPHPSGVGFDLPAVRSVFEAYVSRSPVAARIRFQSGSFRDARCRR